MGCFIFCITITLQSKQFNLLRNNEPYITTKDFFKSGETFQLLWNDHKDMLITHPQPEPSKLASYYESEEYISHNDAKKGLVPFLYNAVKSWSLKNKMKLVESFVSEKGALLDIGAGTGEFCKIAKEKGWHVDGVEPNENARNFAATKNIFLEQDLASLTHKKYDVITLWHVLEHLPDLETKINDITTLLHKGGILIIAVPNFKSYDARYYNEFWAAYDVPRHLWHFSKKSITRLFSKQYTLEKIKPMVFDSFYVSLLSEKYKTGNTFSLKAFWIGLLSNFKAISTKQYSSHIYCLKKGRKNP